MFKNKVEINELLKHSNSNLEAISIMKYLEKLKTKRKVFYLTNVELEMILCWKLKNQINRQIHLRKNNSNENIILVTKTAFLIQHKDENIEITLKLKTLSLLFGVEIPVASAILTLCFPESYAVIDFRNWRQLYNSERKKSSYSIKEYLDYLSEIKKIANNFNFTIQQIDLAIWQKDKNERN